MAIIQLAKQILGVRAFYQDYKVRRWLAGRGINGGGAAAYRDLIRGLGYGKGEEAALGRSETRALFNLPIEQLAAQVSLAADLALSYPGEYRALLEALTGQRDGAERGPSAGPSAGASAGPSAGPSAGASAGPSAGPSAGASAGPSAGPSAGAGDRTDPPNVITDPSGESIPIVNLDDAAVSQVSEQDIRRSYQVRSGVDALQLYVGQGWRRTVRLAAVLISGLLGVIWLEFLDIQPNLVIAYILSALILGGFISWFLRDLVAIVERLRS